MKKKSRFKLSFTSSHPTTKGEKIEFEGDADYISERIKYILKGLYPTDLSTIKIESNEATQTKITNQRDL